jgi:hypothetical protein
VPIFIFSIKKMASLKNAELVRERRRMCALDAIELAAQLGLSEAEKKDFMFSADSNAIWDAQANYPYRKPVYTPKQPAVTGPMYSELGFLSEEQKKRLFSGTR